MRCGRSVGIVVAAFIQAGNLLLGSGGEVKLADFGVAAELGGGRRRTVIGKHTRPRMRTQQLARGFGARVSECKTSRSV